MGNFTEKKLQDVWEKGSKKNVTEPEKWRKDACGAWIYWEHYGKESDYGWDVDHIVPKVLGGTDDLRNLRPLHWQNNKSKASNYPDYMAAVTSDGTKNILHEKRYNIPAEVQNELNPLYGIRVDLYKKIKEHFKDDESGEYWDDYIVGISDAPKDVMLKQNQVPEDDYYWIISKAADANEAVIVKKMLLEAGFEEEKTHSSGIYIFAYRKMDVG